MDTVINVENLSHQYGSQQALNNLSFQVNHGEVFGLLGPNGAGKTTSVRLLNGMFEATSGHLQVMGFDPKSDGEKIREGSGVLTETPALYERLTARQNLKFFGTLAGLTDSQITKRTEELLDLFGLSERSNVRTGTFSKGMKQRLALARTWLNHPRLLFLDEPTSGLDPEAAVQVRELIAEVREQEGATVFLCTHNLDEAQRLCDRLLIMGEGTALAQGTLPELRRLISPGLWLEIKLITPFPQLKSIVIEKQASEVLQVDMPSDDVIRLQVGSESAIPDVVSWLVQSGARILKVQPQEISLEEIYLQLQNSNHHSSKHAGG
jgi:ABC-2 type transport system ATP-binding protein